MAMIRNLRMCLNEINYYLYNLNKLQLRQELQRESKNFQFKYFNTTNKNWSEKTQKAFKEVINKDGEKVMKKLHSTPKVLLYDLDGKISSIYLEEAKKLATRKGLELLQVESEAKKPTYKLVKGTLTDETVDSITEKNADKLNIILINSNITYHDFETKKKQIMKLLNKKKNLQIVLSNKKNDERTKELADELEKAFGSEYRIVSNFSNKKGCKLYIYGSEEKSTNVNEEKNK